MRTHHAPNSADRERVRNALARRLENGSSKAALSVRGDGWALLGRGAYPVLASVSLGIAVALIAVTFAVVRSRESLPLGAAALRVTRTSTVQTGAEAQASVVPVVSVDEPLASSPVASPPVASNVGLGDRGRLDSDGRLRELRQAVPPTAASPGQGSRSHLGKRGKPESHPEATSAVAAARDISTKGDPKESAARMETAPAAGQSLVAEVTTRAPLATEAPLASEEQAGRLGHSLYQRAAPATTHAEPDGRAELALARRMLSAWTQAELAHVLELSMEHERRWPHGTFAQEREGLRAMAECLSHVRNAGARAQTFLASFPRAPLAARVRKACSAQLKSLASVTRD